MKNDPRPNFRSVALQIGTIVAATFIVYLPALRGGFVWDDEQLVSRNPLLQTLSGLAEIWSGGRTADYFPLTNSFFWIEHQIFGDNAAGYHAINVLLQAADALLVWLVLRQLKIPGAWLAGFLFAIHPVNAESVAWISELKNVLALFFALLSLLIFLRAANFGQLFLSLVFFVLALISKSQTVVLPIIILFCGWWRDRDLNRAGFRRDAFRTWPFFAIALVFGLITLWFQSRGIGEEQIASGLLGRRMVNAGMAVWWYAAKVFVPARLSAIYPPWRFGSPTIFEWLPLVLIIVAVILLWRFRNRGTDGLFFTIGCFITALLPVLGFFRMAYSRSGTLVADHLQYFATVPLIACIAAAISILWNRDHRLVRPLITAGLIIAAIALGSYTVVRAAVFQNEPTLWADTLAKNPYSWQAHVRLGQYLFDRGQFAEALPYLQRAVELKPELADNRNLLGLDYCRLQRFDDGIAEYREALRLKETQSPGDATSSVATIRTNLANALTLSAANLSAPDQALRYEEAIHEYERALAIEPNQPAIHRNLGMVLTRVGRYSEAAEHLRKTLELVPNEATARQVLDQIESARR